ncbi:hypothetical protein [Bosea sp. 124]|uniref:hypothetical protein n=1 Tax=Bosea sp. 124 TaxID=2135642 RepID=UPI000D362200|nr:hypothetical protein [Bosea sp. 124]PTM40145.1 hypothetical protein C8D03_1656 [Bosea sp. 124]
MNFLSYFWHRLAEGFAVAAPAKTSEPADPAFAQDEAGADEARRTSIHDVTHEQLGLAHWSCHALF